MSICANWSCDQCEGMSPPYCLALMHMLPSAEMCCLKRIHDGQSFTSGTAYMEVELLAEALEEYKRLFR